MSSEGLAKITAKTAAEVCKHFPLGEEAKKLLRDGLTPAQFLDTLIDKQQFPDAVRFLAHAPQQYIARVSGSLRPAPLKITVH